MTLTKKESSIADAVFHRVVKARDNLKENLNEIFPLDQVPSSILTSQRLDHVFYGLENETMCQIIIGYLPSAGNTQAPIKWRYFTNSVHFYHEFDYSTGN